MKYSTIIFGDTPISSKYSKSTEALVPIICLIRSAVLYMIEHQFVTDRQTHRRTHDHSYVVAQRRAGKNGLNTKQAKPVLCGHSSIIITVSHTHIYGIFVTVGSHIFIIMIIIIITCIFCSLLLAYLYHRMQ